MTLEDARRPVDATTAGEGDAGRAPPMVTYDLVCRECGFEKRGLSLAEVAHWSQLHYAATGHIPDVRKHEAGE